jgi:hypothetical protein
LEHPSIEKLSDPIHFIKNYKSELYGFVVQSKAKSETCKADALRLSRNLAYMVAQHTPGSGDGELTFEKFQKAGEASFEHHCNNHEHCGSWCQAKNWTAAEKIQFKHKYRDKELNPKEYEQQKKVKEKFLEPARMWRIYHEWCNNKTEQIHGLVVNVFMPKRSYFCRTICGRARTNLAVSIDSLGYLDYYRLLYLDLGIRMTSVTETFYRQHDKKRKADQAYTLKPERKKLRAKQKLENINKEWKKEIIDKRQGNTYRSKMMCPKVGLNEDGSIPTVAQAKGTTDKNGARKFCKACQNYGLHQRRTSLLCPKNPKSVHYVGT